MFGRGLLLAAAVLAGCGGKQSHHTDESRLCDGYSNPELEADVARFLSLAAGSKPTAEQLQRVTALSTSGLESLDGVQCLPNLGHLSLHRGRVTDLSPLASLESFAALEVTQSPPPDLPSLGRAASNRLTSLSITASTLSELGMLSDLAALVKLDLSNNQLTQLRDLPPLPQLQELVVDGNSISDLSAVQRLPSLKRLSADSNGLATLSELNGHPSLADVSAAKNQLTTLGDLRQAQLTNLELSSNQIEELGPLRGLSNLLSLGLAGNALKSLAGIADLPALRRLSLQDTPIVDLQQLTSLENLEELTLTGSRVVDLAPLSALSHVRILKLDGSGVVSLGPLEPWAKLAGNCRRITAAELELDVASISLARSLCVSGWGVEPICSGACDPHG